MIHHGDQEVEQNYHVDDWVGTEHEHSPEACEVLDAFEIEACQVYQTERRPEKSLSCFPQAAMCTEINNEKTFIKNFMFNLHFKLSNKYKS